MGIASSGCRLRATCSFQGSHLHVAARDSSYVCSDKGDESQCHTAGDSRCVMCRDGEAVAMTEDHKPTDAAENERITKARRTHRRAQVSSRWHWLACRPAMHCAIA